MRSREETLRCWEHIQKWHVVEKYRIFFSVYIAVFVYSYVTEKGLCDRKDMCLLCTHRRSLCSKDVWYESWRFAEVKIKLGVKLELSFMTHIKVLTDVTTSSLLLGTEPQRTFITPIWYVSLQISGISYFMIAEDTLAETLNQHFWASLGGLLSACRRSRLQLNSLPSIQFLCIIEPTNQ